MYDYIARTSFPAGLRQVRTMCRKHRHQRHFRHLQRVFFNQRTDQVNPTNRSSLYFFHYYIYIYCYKMYFDQCGRAGVISAHYWIYACCEELFQQSKWHNNVLYCLIPEIEYILKTNNAVSHNKVSYGSSREETAELFLH